MGHEAHANRLGSQEERNVAKRWNRSSAACSQRHRGCGSRRGGVWCGGAPRVGRESLWAPRAPGGGEGRSRRRGGKKGQRGLGPRWWGRRGCPARVAPSARTEAEERTKARPLRGLRGRAQARPWRGGRGGGGGPGLGATGSTRGGVRGPPYLPRGGNSCLAYWERRGARAPLAGRRYPRVGRRWPSSPQPLALGPACLLAPPSRPSRHWQKPVEPKGSAHAHPTRPTASNPQ